MEETNQTPSKNNNTYIGAAIFVVVAILAFVLNSGKTVDTKVAPSVPTVSVSPATNPSTETTVDGAEINDGTYEATGEYTSPAGPEVVPIKLTLKNGVIETIEFNQKVTNPGSIKFQGMFKEGYKALVVGKKITEVKLDKVSGSSLTPKGFNDAIQKIITQNS